MHVQVWRPPCDIATLGELPEALGVTVLRESSFEPISLAPVAVVEGQALASRFVSAVEQLSTYLAEHDDRCARGYSRWRSLAATTLVSSRDLAVEVVIDGTKLEVPTCIHLKREPLTIYVSSEEALADANVGGRIIASLFDLDESGKITVGLAWEYAWRRAAVAGLPDRSVYLAESEQEEGPASEPAGGKKSAGKRPRERHSRRDPVDGSSESDETASRPQTRELKSFDDIKPIVDTVESEDASGKVRVTDRRGLKSDDDVAPPAKGTHRAPQGALRGTQMKSANSLASK